LNKAIALALILVAVAALIAGCDSKADTSSNYDYVPAYGTGCGVAGPAPAHSDVPQLAVNAMKTPVL